MNSGTKNSYRFYLDSDNQCFKAVFIFLFLLFFCRPSFGQEHEVGGWLGTTNYFGDLNTNVSFKYTRPGAGIFYRYNIQYRWAWRTSVNYGIAEFSDRVNNDPWNQQRNLSFRSNIFDVSTMMEFNFFKYDKASKKDKWTPYIGIGLGVFFFNPEAKYNGQWYYLQGLGTEGQNDPSYSGVKKYRPYSFAIPMVMGFKFSFLRNWNIGIEGGLRQCFTDYLDDVSGKYPSFASLPGGSSGLAAALSDRSAENGGEKIGKAGRQRGDNSRSDQYLFMGVTLSYTIMRPRCPTVSGGNTYR